MFSNTAQCITLFEIYFQNDSLPNIYYLDSRASAEKKMQGGGTMSVKTSFCFNVILFISYFPCNFFNFWFSSGGERGYPPSLEHQGTPMFGLFMEVCKPIFLDFRDYTFIIWLNTRYGWIAIFHIFFHFGFLWMHISFSDMLRLYKCMWQ